MTKSIGLNCIDTALTRIFTWETEIWLRGEEGMNGCCDGGNELLAGDGGCPQKARSGRASFLIVGSQKSPKLDLPPMT